MERLEIIGTVIASVLTAFGGWEAIKYLLNKDTNKRIAEAEADSVEFTLLRDTNNFLQEQLQNKEHRFAEQTELVRKLNTEKFDLLQENAQFKLELQRYKCFVKGCTNRDPQNGYLKRQTSIATNLPLKPNSPLLV